MRTPSRLILVGYPVPVASADRAAAARPASHEWREMDAPTFMADERIRRQIAFLAAQMMYQRTESEYFTAKRKAAKQLGVEYRLRPGDLPSNREIRDQIQAMARMHEGPKRL